MNTDHTMLHSTADLTPRVQSTLKDFQNTMKVARSKEASSLPKPSPAELAKLQAPGGPLEEAEAGRGDPLESAALLQVRGSCGSSLELHQAAGGPVLQPSSLSSWRFGCVWQIHSLHHWAPLPAGVVRLLKVAQRQKLVAQRCGCGML